MQQKCPLFAAVQVTECGAYVADIQCSETIRYSEVVLTMFIPTL